MKTLSVEKHAVYFIVSLAIVFYLPFLSRQFIGDDWLCLSYSKIALSNPEIFFQRSIIYGYFRPLSLWANFLWYFIFGVNAYFHSFMSILLHAANVYLFWKLTDKLNH